MTIDLSLLCDAATVDAAGKLNVLGVFDRIQARELPARHGRICLVIRLAARAGDAGEHTAEIRLVTPDGEDLVRLDGKLQVGPAHGDEVTRIPHVLNLDGLVFPKEGAYSFEIAIDGDPLASIPLRIVHAPAGSGGAGRGGGPPGSGGSVGPEGVPIIFAPGGPAKA
jgi:hypothetical protein